MAKRQSKWCLWQPMGQAGLAKLPLGSQWVAWAGQWAAKGGPRNGFGWPKGGPGVPWAAKGRYCVAIGLPMGWLGDFRAAQWVPQGRQGNESVKHSSFLERSPGWRRRSLGRPRAPLDSRGARPWMAKAHGRCLGRPMHGWGDKWTAIGRQASPEGAFCGPLGRQVALEAELWISR